MNALGQIVGALGGTVMMLLVVATIVLAYAVPLMWFSVTRNVAKTRRALERIADALDERRTGGGGGVLGI